MNMDNEDWEDNHAADNSAVVDEESDGSYDSNGEQDSF